MTSENKEITCIICPIGCKITVNTHGKKIEFLDGNKCKKGIEYARSEALDPRRMLTSSILVENGEWPLVSVKTSKPVPKNKISSIMAEIKKKKVKAPIGIGQVLITNIDKTGIDIIATKNIQLKKLEG